jgi:hypothetical protein
MKKYLLILVIIVGLCACNIKKLDTKQLTEQMKRNEIKRITESQVVSFANDWSQQIQANLAKKNTDTAALAQKYHAQIQKVRLTDTTTITDIKEKELMGAFAYAKKNKIDIPLSLQKINNGEAYICFLNVNTDSTAAWRIKFSKKDVINAVSVKDIKNKTIR